MCVCVCVCDLLHCSRQVTTLWVCVWVCVCYGCVVCVCVCVYYGCVICYVCVYLCVLMCVFVCLCVVCVVCVCVCVHVDGCGKRIQLSIHIYTPNIAHTHTYIHTHAGSLCT